MLSHCVARPTLPQKIKPHIYVFRHSILPFRFASFPDNQNRWGTWYIDHGNATRMQRDIGPHTKTKQEKVETSMASLSSRHRQQQARNGRKHFSELFGRLDTIRLNEKKQLVPTMDHIIFTIEILNRRPKHRHSGRDGISQSHVPECVRQIL